MIFSLKQSVLEIGIRNLKRLADFVLDFVLISDLRFGKLKFDFRSYESGINLFIFSVLILVVLLSVGTIKSNLKKFSIVSIGYSNSVKLII